MWLCIWRLSAPVGLTVFASVSMEASTRPIFRNERPPARDRSFDAYDNPAMVLGFLVVPR